MKCEKHKLKKDYLLCLDDGCEDRLVCEKCFHIQHKHQNHKYILIKYFMENEDEEINRIFNKGYIEMMGEKSEDTSWVQILDSMIN